MRKKFEDLPPYLIAFLERGMSIVAFIFPFIEVASYFGPKVFLNTGSFALKSFYFNHIAKIARFYADNSILVFIFMIWVFIMCSRRSSPFTKFVRFNVIQAILLNIVCACLGVIFSFLPIVLRESMFGFIFANLSFFSIVLLMGYSSLLIAYGKLPVIPVVSEAAKTQVQR
jgi:uncharacterized membrane protein